MLGTDTEVINVQNPPSMRRNYSPPHLSQESSALVSCDNNTIIDEPPPCLSSLDGESVTSSDDSEQQRSPPRPKALLTGMDADDTIIISMDCSEDEPTTIASPSCAPSPRHRGTLANHEEDNIRFTVTTTTTCPTPMSQSRGSARQRTIRSVSKQSLQRSNKARARSSDDCTNTKSCSSSSSSGSSSMLARDVVLSNAHVLPVETPRDIRRVSFLDWEAEVMDEDKPTWLSPKEKELYFWSDREVSHLRLGRKGLINVFRRHVLRNHGEQWSEEKDSVRGLEDHYQDLFGRPSSHSIRRSHARCVMTAHYQMKAERGKCDAEALREVSKRSSRKVSVRAMEMATEDAFAARSKGHDVDYGKWKIHYRSATALMERLHDLVMCGKMNF